MSDQSLIKTYKHIDAIVNTEQALMKDIGRRCYWFLDVANMYLFRLCVRLTALLVKVLLTLLSSSSLSF